MRYDSVLKSLQKLSTEAEQRYRREQELMLGHLHALGMKLTKQHLVNQPKTAGGGGPSSWLGQQRMNVRD
jgi:protein HOOK3